MSSDHAPIASRSEFHAALRAGFAQAAALASLELWLCDADFADWPLGERNVIDQLTAWAGPQRRLTLLAHNFDAVARRHPRWVGWRRDFSHLVQCRVNPELEAGRLPTLLLIPGVLRIQLSDPVHYRGSVSLLPSDLLRCRQSIDAVLQQSVDAFPATTTGL